jgi:hypothetical protein
MAQRRLATPAKLLCECAGNRELHAIFSLLLAATSTSAWAGSFAKPFIGYRHVGGTSHSSARA